MRRLLSATVYTRLALALAATTAAVAAATTPAEAAGSGWRLVDLGTLGGACCSQATAINDHGDVVGDSGTGPGMSPRHAFLWRHGRMVDLGTLGGTFSTATDINNRRAIVGFSSLADGSTHAVLWRESGTIDLGTLGGLNSYATGVNDAGDVVGYSETGASGLRAFVWHDGTMTELGLLNGGSAVANDIDAWGRVVGQSTVDGMNSVPVRWRLGYPTSLASLNGTATATNDDGQVAGYAFGGNGSFLWSDGTITDLGTLPGATFVQAFGINDRGEVVGYTDHDAFIWQGGRMTALPRPAGGATGASALDVNDDGQVVGVGYTSDGGVSTAHAVLWSH